MLLKISRRKNTKWWLLGAENKNQGVLKASNKCNNFVLATMERVFKYGDTKTKHKYYIVLHKYRDA